MRYLSMDLEATGLKENDLIIELAFVPINAEDHSIEDSLAKHYYVKCPSFESLEKNLDPWVIEHNEDLIRKAHQKGLSIQQIKNDLESYFNSKSIQEYFHQQKIVLFGKSMNAIDLPFLNRDFGWEWMRRFFKHRVHDLSSVVYHCIDQERLAPKMESGSELMKYLNLGDVAHTALEDARNTALMYFMLLERLNNKKSL